MKEYIPTISGSIGEVIRSIGYLQPEWTLLTGFILVIVADITVHERHKLTLLLAAGTFIANIYLNLIGLKPEMMSLFGGMIVLDHMGRLMNMLIGIVGLITCLFVQYNKPFQNHKKGLGDFFAILIAIQLGLSLMVMSRNLIMIYVSVEMVSIGSYLMVGYLSDSKKYSEAAMKYAIFGAVCSAFMLYGMSLLYAYTGTLDIATRPFIDGLIQTPMLTWAIATGMVYIGLGFKLSLVPFHFWAPDVYEGAPAPVAAFLSTAPKIAAVVLFIRFTGSLMPLNFLVFGNSFQINSIIAMLALASMIFGNFGALWQNNTRRMLAYSSIGHTGFILMGLFMFSSTSLKAVSFYLFVYAIMNMAAFMIADEIEERTGFQNISEYRGLGSVAAVLMTAMVVVLVSLTGLPPTAGFTAKFLVFSAALESYSSTNSAVLIALIITAALTTLVSLFYYFKIPLNAFLRDGNHTPSFPVSSPKSIVSLILAALLIVLIIYPSLVQQFI